MCACTCMQVYAGMQWVHAGGRYLVVSQLVSSLLHFSMFRKNEIVAFFYDYVLLGSIRLFLHHWSPVLLFRHQLFPSGDIIPDFRI